MSEKKNFLRLLEANGFRFKRRRKHFIYCDNKGHVFTLSKSPSCHRTYKNNVSDLKKAVARAGRPFVELE